MHKKNQDKIILFICKSNFGRSQIAEAIFNQKSKIHKAISAGIKEGRATGCKLKEFPEHSNLFTCMDELGLNVRENTSKLLTSATVKKVDKIIVMVARNIWPDYLRELEELDKNKVVPWRIKDLVGGTLDEYSKERDKIKNKVENLVAELYGESSHPE